MISGDTMSIEYMLQEFLTRADLPLTNLKGLCADMPMEKFSTLEVNNLNGFYGNSEALKRYVGLPSYYAIKADISHGYTHAPYEIWDMEISNITPVTLVWGEHTKKSYQRYTDKNIIVIGAPFFYSTGILSSNEVKSEKKRLGRNLLIFPPHATHYVTNSYDCVRWINSLKSTFKEFDSVRICMYWKNYINGEHKYYKDMGYECVTAGHMFDINFLRRLHSLFDICDATIAGNLGSNVGFSLFKKKPIMLAQPTKTVVTDTLNHVSDEEYKRYLSKDIFYQKALDIFATLPERVPQKQYDFCDPYWGFSAIKQPHELLTIIRDAESLYSKMQCESDEEVGGFKLSDFSLPDPSNISTSAVRNMLVRHCHKLAVAALNAREMKKAAFLAKYGLELGIPYRGLAATYGSALTALQQFDAAKAAFQRELTAFPDSQTAQKSLSTIEKLEVLQN